MHLYNTHIHKASCGNFIYILISYFFSMIILILIHSKLWLILRRDDSEWPPQNCQWLTLLIPNATRGFAVSGLDMTRTPYSLATIHTLAGFSATKVHILSHLSSQANLINFHFFWPQFITTKKKIPLCYLRYLIHLRLYIYFSIELFFHKSHGERERKWFILLPRIQK